MKNDQKKIKLLPSSGAKSGTAVMKGDDVTHIHTCTEHLNENRHTVDEHNVLMGLR